MNLPLKFSAHRIPWVSLRKVSKLVRSIFSSQKVAFISPTRNLIGDGDPRASTVSAYILNLGQVYRPILSLGLKFTPRGESFSVPLRTQDRTKDFARNLVWKIFRLLASGIKSRLLFFMYGQAQTIIPVDFISKFSVNTAYLQTLHFLDKSRIFRGPDFTAKLQPSGSKPSSLLCRGCAKQWGQFQRSLLSSTYVKLAKLLAFLQLMFILGKIQCPPKV
jgi:hypothetical protein